MKKKMITAFLAVTMIAGLAGCGGNSEETATTPAAENETQAADSATAEADTADYSEDLPSDYEGTLTMWGWEDAWFETITTAFNEKYPNVKIQYTPMGSGDTLQKYQTGIASGTELPDIAWAIIDSRAKVYELDMWEDLSAAPYNFDINSVYECTHDRIKNSKGAVCGIEQCLTPAGLAYRKDLAKEYFGTDDKEELEAMLATWDDFIAKGKEVNEKSNGEVFMMQGLADAQLFIREQGGVSWIDGTTIKATESLKKSLELACELRDNNAVDKLEAWSPAWYASFGEGKHIFAGCATWSIALNIEANDPEGETTGHWGLMNAPEGNISWGGTTVGITKTCKDKRLAWEFIKFATLSTEGAEAMNKIGYLTSAKQPYIDNPELKSMKSAWFGDEDLGLIYMDEILPNIETRPMNYDDNVVHETLDLVTTALNNDSSMTADDAMNQLKTELETKLPDYTVE